MFKRYNNYGGMCLNVKAYHDMLCMLSSLYGAVCELWLPNVYLCTLVLFCLVWLNA